jgi:glycosyltransferase involved in cell wall biosynthesis
LRQEDSLNTNANFIESVRILYSFPHRLGTGRIADTAWYQVKGVAEAGGQVRAFTVSNHKQLPESVQVKQTLSRGNFRLPFRFLGRIRTFALHDYRVAQAVERLAGSIDIVHVWPLGAIRTLRVARKLGIPAVLERPNAHTRYAYEVVQKECQRLGLSMPDGHEHAYNPEILRLEEEEYQLADRLLCPSEFVARTFREQGFPAERLARHQYGFDDKLFQPRQREGSTGQNLSMLFVGGCAPRKGLHYALEAWLKSPAKEHGTFQIAGAFIPGYAEKLAPMLSHPSVRVLGHRTDVAELMRNNDVLVLPSIEEGSALVTLEARGSGCVLLVSDAAGAICEHMENGLVHPVGDVNTLTQHLTLLAENRTLLERLRAASLRTVREITWDAAGIKLLKVYREIIEENRSNTKVKAVQHKAAVDA